MHDGVDGPAGVVVPMLSDAFQERQFAVLDDIGETRETMPTRGSGLK